jgi:hypothetical protein
MDPTRLMTQTCTITHVADTGAADPYGDPAEMATTTTSPCFLSFTPGTENTDETVQIQTPTLFIPPGAALDGGDRVAVDGVTYQVDGVPAVHFNPRLRRTTHIQATLKRAG